MCPSAEQRQLDLLEFLQDVGQFRLTSEERLQLAWWYKRTSWKLADFPNHLWSNLRCLQRPQSCQDPSEGPGPATQQKSKTGSSYNWCFQRGASKKAVVGSCHFVCCFATQLHTPTTQKPRSDMTSVTLTGWQNCLPHQSVWTNEAFQMNGEMPPRNSVQVQLPSFSTSVESGRELLLNFVFTGIWRRRFASIRHYPFLQQPVRWCVLQRPISWPLQTPGGDRRGCGVCCCQIQQVRNL